MTSTGEHGLFCVKFYLCEKYISAKGTDLEKWYREAWILVARLYNRNQDESRAEWNALKDCTENG